MTVQRQQDDLIALVGSRICHDLISPIGAIGNGVELMSMTGSGGEQELALISESVEQANARIRFFRVAFGYASPGQELGLREIRSILGDMTRGGRVKIDWDVGADVLRAEARLAFLLLLCIESALAFGGTVRVSLEDGAWRIDGVAEKLRIEEAPWQLLAESNPEAKIASATVQFALAPLVARDIGRKITADLGQDRIVIRF
ncbi:histidine phosphotransferase family protein [Poseidonocella sedimentorum]|uniref:Histidine phosphotransferase ChpT n=1 Tax=Poseidonocella sedimentorum TaxID=871652 RepID=A0A1I6EIA3_9RHOB|nr:histidine phosphotransferase family protein [Poseidonocella sedimentorum]SFR17484.1 histidine phosphotransferase ChpT [Poseidonocella sedimentorum]